MKTPIRAAKPQAINEPWKVREFNSERKNLLVPLYAAAACRPDGVAQRVMDDLLRECLRRKSLTPRVLGSALHQAGSRCRHRPFSGVLTPILFTVLEQRRFWPRQSARRATSVTGMFGSLMRDPWLRQD